MFDGLSCGQIALERAGIKVDKYYASEIDKYAIQVTQRNYPNTIQLGNILDHDKWELPKIDLLIGGSPCFVAGTRIITDKGYKNIEDIRQGEKVLTHENRYKQVLKTGGDIKKIYVVEAQGIKKTETTANHPYYIREMSKKFNSETKKTERVFSEPKWKKVSEIKKGDFIGVPIINVEKNDYGLTEEDCWLLGRYLADGHYRDDDRKGRKNSKHYQVIFSVGNAKVDEFKKEVKSHFSCYPHSQSVHRCVISSKRLVELIVKERFGKGAANKRIPQFILELPIDLAKKFLDGYLSGDGCYKKDCITASSISEELVMGANLLIAKCYKVNSSLYFNKVKREKIIEGRTVKQNDIYSLSFRKEMKKQSVAKVIDDIIWLPVKNIYETERVDQVYNLEVEEDNSYTANNAIVHNCQDLSRIKSKDGQGLKGEKSKLFYEFVDCIKQFKPKYFLLENVIMDKNSENTITELLGVDPIEINSSHFSAQDRRRLYWTNIPLHELLPDNQKVIKDILEEHVDDKYYYDDKLYINDLNKRVVGSLHRYYPNEKVKMTETTSRVYNPNFKAPTLTAVTGGHQEKKVYIDGKVRKLTPLEYERLQTVEDNYTATVSNSQRYKMLGNGWTVDVIAHIFKNIK